MYRNRFTIVLIVAECFLISSISAEEIFIPGQVANLQDRQPLEGRALFNPRVDYNNKWIPVGHSDPLKNDPTFDYSPPVLDRVRYWPEYNDNEDETISSNNNNNIQEKKEILVLGVPSKHTLYSHNHPNQVIQMEPKSSNRRNFYAAQPSRILTPPPMSHSYMTAQMGYQSDYGIKSPSTDYWVSESSIPNPSDANADESASYFTVIKPQFTQIPYLATSPSVYKGASNSIYGFAANVNSLEASDKKTPWLQNLLQKEVTYQPETTTTTPQVILAYSPPVFESHSTQLNDIYQHENQNIVPVDTTTPFTPTTMPAITLTTDQLFSHYKQPVEPLRGPMYLIIQGHSKVKTYGQQSDIDAIKHLPKMVPVISTKDPVITHVVSEDDHGNEIQVTHMHKIENSESNAAMESVKMAKTQSNSTMGSLLSLLDSSFAGFFLNDNETKYKSTDNKTNKNVSVETPASVTGQVNANNFTSHIS